MSHTIEQIALKAPSPGTQRFLVVHKFNNGTPGPKVYIQAALHADEWPGLLTLQHLLEQLIVLEKENNIRGEIVIVPFANPIGLDQKINGCVLGRHSFSAEGNFNRYWPDFSETVRKLTTETSATVGTIKQGLIEAAKNLPSNTPLEQLKAVLIGQSIDADIVLELHCDSEAIMHIFSNYRHKEQSETLAKCISSPLVLLEDTLIGSPFDVAHIQPWIEAEKANIPFACFAATIELRGFVDVSDELAAKDAIGILKFLTNQKSLDTSLLHDQNFKTETTNLTAVDFVCAPDTGIITWKVAIGDTIEKNQIIAEIVNIESLTPNKERTAVFSRTKGVLFARPMARLATQGDIIAKIAGKEDFENPAVGLTL